MKWNKPHKIHLSSDWAQKLILNSIMYWLRLNTLLKIQLYFHLAKSHFKFSYILTAEEH